MQALLRFLLRGHLHKLSHDEVTTAFGAAVYALAFIPVHAFYFAFHLVTGATYLALVNVASVAVYSLALAINAPTRGKISTLLIFLEVSAYCVTATYFLGLGAGNYGFLPLMIIGCLMTLGLSIRAQVVYVSLLLTSLIACLIVGLNVPAYYGGDTRVMMIINAATASLGGLLLGVLLYSLRSFTERSYRVEIALLSDEINIDPLTQIGNRRHIQGHLDKLYADDAQLESAFIAMVDIDLFKKVNDTYGHGVGDEVLRYIAALLKVSFRSSDVAARWGGEEFLVLLRGTDSESARMVLENFRRKFAFDAIPTSAGPLHATVTIGFCGARIGESAEICVQHSDEALYYGKNNGRNTVIFYDEIPEKLNQKSHPNPTPCSE